MNNDAAPKRETAVLEGGPADGLRVQVLNCASVLQVTYPCPVEPSSDEPAVQALFIYRRDPFPTGQPVRYGFDSASP